MRFKTLTVLIALVAVLGCAKKKVPATGGGQQEPLKLPSPTLPMPEVPAPPSVPSVTTETPTEKINTSPVMPNSISTSPAPEKSPSIPSNP